MKKRIVLILLVLTSIFSLAACGTIAGSGSTPTSSGSSGSTPASSGSPSGASAAPAEITVANNIIPNGLDPLTEDAAHNYAITYHIYDRLIDFDPTTNEWLPRVAKSWKQVDAVTWEFEINLDYVFSNGAKLTMDDVIFSFNRLSKVPKQADAAKMINNVSYKGNILTFVAANSSVTIPARVLSAVVIINKAYVEAGGDDAIFLKPVGTGPYKVTKFTPGAGATIELWKGYPFAEPKIDKINFIAIAENSTRYVALETGKAQFVGYLSVLEYNLGAKNSKESVVNVPSRRSFSLMFNCQKPPFDNVNVRRALAFALDREGFCKLAGGGRSPLKSMLFFGYKDLYAESAAAPDYNMDKAKTMLQEAGYSASHPLNVDMICVESDPGIEMYQAALADIGVKLNVKILEHSVYLTREGAGEFDMAYVAQTNRGNHPLSDLDRFDSTMIGSRDISRYSNDRVQKLLTEIRTTTDKQKLTAMIKEVNDILGQDVPMVAVYLSPLFFAMDKKLTGVEISPIQIVNFRNATFSR